MKTREETIREILERNPSAAAVRLLDGTPGPFSRADMETIEVAILNNASRGARLDKLVTAMHAIVASLDPSRKPTTIQCVIHEFPKYKNVLAAGFSEPEEIYEMASKWLNSGVNPGGRQAGLTQSSASLLAKLVVALILDFQILDEDAIPSLIESLRVSRVVWMHRRDLAGIPLAVRRGQQEHAVERYIVAGGRTAKILRQLLKHASVQSHLAAVAQPANWKPQKILRFIDKELPIRKGSPVFTIYGLIDAACQVAIQHMPTSVLADRRSLFVSHALDLKALIRIGLLGDIPLFPQNHSSSAPETPSQESGEDSKDNAEEGEKEQDEKEEREGEAGWMVELRAAVKKKSIDRPMLQAHAKGAELGGKRMAEYALHLESRQFASSTIHRYVFLIADRLMPRLEGDDPKLLSQDDWDEQVEQILDHDAFFRHKRYAEGDGRNAAGYSRPLLKALGSFVTYFNRGKEAGDRVRPMLPASGLVNVEANLITVDEYTRAYKWLSGVKASGNPYMRKASRAALIVGFRCGLRLAECAFLRVCDFDALLAGQTGYEANVHLHVRPWFLRKLKTSNALRDLPLRALMTPDELEEVMDFVEEARKVHGAKTLLFRQLNNPLKALKFGAIIDSLQKAFQGSSRKRAAFQFHFHLLRHSFSNICLLRLWPGLHEVARHILKNHPETLDWIKDTKGFRLQLFGTGMIGDSDLQAIALLMGHGSAATTCEHYLHVLSWYRPVAARGSLAARSSGLLKLATSDGAD